MKKLFYLSSCSTCKRILNILQPGSDVVLRDIKQKPLNIEEIEQMYQLSGSYEALFSKRAQLYKQRNLKDKTLTEIDFKNLLLEHYTFLKRPVLILNARIFIGNASGTVEEAKKALDDQP